MKCVPIRIIKVRRANSFTNLKAHSHITSEVSKVGLTDTLPVFYLVTARIGKVMFQHVSVCLSTGEGRTYLPANRGHLPWVSSPWPG